MHELRGMCPGLPGGSKGWLQRRPFNKKSGMLEIDFKACVIRILHSHKNKINNVQLINADCRNVNIKNYADRILMGYHNADATHLKKAIEISKNSSILHLHPLAKPGNYKEWIEWYIQWINHNSAETELIRVKKIKNYSPGLHHIEIVIKIHK